MTERDIDLHPGQLYFSEKPMTIRTILGSCVSLTVWHPNLRVGGMCHYLMANCKLNTTKDKMDFRYANNALEYLLTKMRLLAPAENYQLGLFGGSKMFPASKSESVGEDNVNFAHRWLKDNSLKLDYENTFGHASRTISLNLNTGEIHLRSYSAVEEEVTHGN